MNNLITYKNLFNNYKALLEKYLEKINIFIIICSLKINIVLYNLFYLFLVLI